MASDSVSSLMWNSFAACGITEAEAGDESDRGSHVVRGDFLPELMEKKLLVLG